MPTAFLPSFLTLLRLALAVATLFTSAAHAQSLFEGLGKALQPQTGTEQNLTAEAAAPATRNLTRTSDGKRLALVIGNDAYQRISKLEKAGNDATAMARELKAAGFDVLLHRDLNYRGMVKAIETLANSITGGDQVVVFFAGHGVQLKTGSYLLPIDIEASSESEVEKTAYGLNDLTEKLAEAKASFTLVMVDACRDNPLKSKGRSVGATRGLSAIEPPKGQMVVYSASKGQQALDRLSDNDRNPNGVFTRAFIARMKKPGVRIEDMMREVQDAVEDLAKSVSHDQRPAIYNESRGNFYFFGPTTVEVKGNGAARARTAEEIEDSYWDGIKGSNDSMVFEGYLSDYPKGRYAAQARNALKQLKGAKPAPVAVSPAPTFLAPSSDPETQFWNEVKASGAREYIEAYLKQYPKGKYLALAKVELKKIEDRQQQEAQQVEQKAWEQAKGENSVASYGSYLERYPKGGYSALAQAAQQKVQRETTERERQAADQEKQEAARRQREQADVALREETERWKRAETATDSKTVQGYLDRYPSGRYLVQAKLKLEAVKKEEAEMKPGKVFKDCAECPEMVFIPAGSFEMGSDEEREERPRHVVRIVQPFGMAKTEVTQGQWIAVMGSNPSKFSGCTECPVERVTWDSAQEFVRKLSSKTGKTYRLPSEAEWEYACRAGGKHKYCGSDNAGAVAWYDDNIDFSSIGAFESILNVKTRTVAGRRPNAWGLYDMNGNVWEWSEDCWNDSYDGAPTDGRAWLSGDCSIRVVRGGARYNRDVHIRAAIRYKFAPSYSDYGDVGLRPIRTVP